MSINSEKVGNYGEVARNIFECDCCGNWVDKWEKTVVDGENLCMECCGECECCGEVMAKEDLEYCDGIILCEECNNDRIDSELDLDVDADLHSEYLFCGKGDCKICFGGIDRYSDYDEEDY